MIENGMEAQQHYICISSDIFCVVQILFVRKSEARKESSTFKDLGSSDFPTRCRSDIRGGDAVTGA